MKDAYTILDTVAVGDAMKNIEKTKHRVIYVSSADDGKVIASITDGDIRRYLLSGGKMTDPVLECSNRDFAYVSHTADEEQILKLFDSKIKSVPRLGPDGSLQER